MLNSRQKVVAVSLLLILLGLSALSTVNAQALQHKPFLAVFDTQGEKVGNILNFDESLRVPVVGFAVEDFTFAVRVLSNCFSAGTEVSGDGDILFFESTNCTGTAFMQKSPPPMPSVVVSGPGCTVYRATDTQQSIPVRSVLIGFGQPGGLCSGGIAAVTSLYQAVPVIDLLTVFTPPFTIR
jgi:hypothetical protein